MKPLPLLGLCLVLLASCTSSTPSVPSALLTEQTVLARDSSLIGRLPRGWISASEESLASGAILWLLREDLAASVAVSELKLDSAAALYARRSGIQAIAAASKTLRGADVHAGEVREIELAGGLSSFGYEMRDARGDVCGRVVVFAIRQKMYECALILLPAAAAAPAPESLERVYRVQEAFIATLKPKVTSS